MAKYWLVVGSRENWETAFKHGNIWGLKERQRHLWESLNEGDTLLFYVTQPIGGIVGRGVLRTKFKQNRPLWPQELRENRLIWPLRFEFDVESCLPPDEWITNKLISKLVWPRAGFQLISQSLGEELVSSLGTQEYSTQADKSPLISEATAEFVATVQGPEEGLPSHDELKRLLVEIGKMQNFIAEPEFPFDIGRLDVVWRRVIHSVPTYAFEIQVGGDIYHALAKLKHAFDLWNSHIFIVAPQADHSKCENLLSGTFHEISDRIKFIELDKVDELYKRKKAYLDFERELGI